MIKIFDGNNYYRRRLETDFTGRAAREIVEEMILETDVCIWVWDGENGNARRRNRYDRYKANRKVVRTDIYAGFETLKNVLRHTNTFQLSVPTFEGDDVIATLARRYAMGGNDVSIYSTDYDFVQLSGEFPRRIFCGAKPKSLVGTDLVRHYKCWVGDPSDNISGIPGFGDVTWERTDKSVLRDTTTNLISTGRHVQRGELSNKVNNWLSEPANAELFRTFWEIVGFYDVPNNLIDQHLIQGVEDFAKADAYLKEWMM